MNDCQGAGQTNSHDHDETRNHVRGFCSQVTYAKLCLSWSYRPSSENMLGGKLASYMIGLELGIVASPCKLTWPGTVLSGHFRSFVDSFDRKKKLAPDPSTGFSLLGSVPRRLASIWEGAPLRYILYSRLRPRSITSACD